MEVLVRVLDDHEVFKLITMFLIFVIQTQRELLVQFRCVYNDSKGID